MAANAIGSFKQGQAITPSNTVDITAFGGKFPVLTDAVYVGSGGDIVVVWENGSTSTLAGALTGTILPIAIRRVNSTNTNASSLVALYNI